MAIAARHDTIRDAAPTAIARRGFHQASIREIARAAHLLLVGLYHYVAGKDHQHDGADQTRNARELFRLEKRSAP